MGGILEKNNSQQQYTMMDEDFKGSALRLVPNHPAAAYLYAVKFARKCTSTESVLCVEVLLDSSDPKIITITEEQPLVFIERMYIHPGTKSGPAVAETILPVLLHFARRFEEEIVV